MHGRITIHFAGGCLEYAAAKALRKAEHIDGAMYRGFCRLYRVMLIMYRRCRTGKIVNFVNFKIQRKSHIVPDKLETRIAVQMFDVALAAGEQVIRTHHFVAASKQAITQMRT